MPKVTLWLTDTGNKALRELAQQMIEAGEPVGKAQKAHADEPSLGKVIEWLVKQERRRRGMDTL